MEHYSSLIRMTISHLAVKYKSNFNYTYDILELRKDSFSKENFCFYLQKKINVFFSYSGHEQLSQYGFNMEHSSGFLYSLSSGFSVYAFAGSGLLLYKIYRIFCFFLFVKFHTYHLTI